MRFAEWVEQHGPEALSELVRNCADTMSRETIRRTRLGRPLRNFLKAQRISDLTGGAVSVAELAQGVPGWERRLRERPAKRRAKRKRR